MSTSRVETHTFQAEIQQLLDIVIHSLYTEKEIFVRELVSNASDALEKFRHLQLTEKEVYDDRLPLEINLTTDETAGTFTIQDFGIGMNHEELVQNLGTIAHSGSKQFLKALAEGERKETASNLIGQFGVGFYSAFMVARKVRVFSRSWRMGESGYCWSSDGAGAYSIEEAEGQRRGCKIVVELKEEYKEFAKDSRIKEIIRRYSNFVPFPINCNGDRVNTVQAIWLRSKNEIKEEEYKEFYKFQANAFDEPLYRLHFSADAPLSINALLFVPSHNPEQMGFGRVDPGVGLYCRKILIDPHPKHLLPEWLRFLKGVVDSEDLPLNISRESMQDRARLEKLGRVLTNRFLKLLEEEAKDNADNYAKFFREFGFFLKEGVATDSRHKEALGKLLRYESSMLEAGSVTSLADYVSRMRQDQKTIYYLFGPDRKTIEAGPYLEGLRSRQLEVLYLYEPVDEFVMQHLMEFEGHKLVAADQDKLDLGGEAPPQEGEALSEAETSRLCAWLKETLGEHVSEVRPSGRLVGSPALALNADHSLSPHMRRMMKAMNKDFASEVRVVLEVNPRHALIRQLPSLLDKDAETAKLVAGQLLDNSLLAAGLLDDPRNMLPRLYELLEKTTRA